jgi:Mor family transcriptional regulator
MTIASLVFTQAIRIGIQKEQAEQLARQLEQVGFPDNIKVRNDRIRAEFNGRNIRELAQKYRLSKSTVYRILM